MPATKLNKKEHWKNLLKSLIYGKMRSMKITSSDLAVLFGISKQAMCRRLRESNLTLEQASVIFNELEFSDEEILRVIRRKKK